MKKFYFIIFAFLFINESIARPLKKDSLKVTITAIDLESMEKMKVFYIKLSKNKVIFSDNYEVSYMSKSKRLKFTVGYIGYKSKKIKLFSDGEIIINVCLEPYKINFDNSR